MYSGLGQATRIARPEQCKCKVIVADSLYGNHIFLAVFLKVKQAFALVRLRSNIVFYGPPKPRKKGQRGKPAKHGLRSKLSDPPRLADQQDNFQLREQTVKLEAWEGLHLKKLPDLVVLDWPDDHTLEGVMSDVPLAFCNRTYLSFSQATPGVEFEPFYGYNLHRSLDVAVWPGILAVAVDA
jgi:hypothetical protein